MQSRIQHPGEGFATFYGTTEYPVFEEFSSWNAQGPRRFADRWKTPPTLHMENSELPVPDWSFAMPEVPIVSQRFVDALGNLLHECAEALPVVVTGSSSTFFALNIFAINGLDLAKSRFTTWQATPGRLKRITHTVFCEDVTAHLFTLRFFPETYCSAEFRDRAEAAGLLGFKCAEQIDAP